MAESNWKNSGGAFQTWLVGMKYARFEGLNVITKVSDGLVVYMWEAWTAAKEDGKAPATTCKPTCETPSECFERGEKCE